jgi:hypothetical protein
MEDEHFSEVPLPEARIDGRRYRLLPAIGTEETTCSECGRSVPNIYTPIRDDSWFCMTDAVVIPLADGLEYVSPAR